MKQDKDPVANEADELENFLKKRERTSEDMLASLFIVLMAVLGAAFIACAWSK